MKVDSLTLRETEVLIYVSKGFASTEVGRLMGIKTYTVNDHLKAVYRKLDVGSRCEAAVIAAKAGIV